MNSKITFFLFFILIFSGLSSPAAAMDSQKDMPDILASVRTGAVYQIIRLVYDRDINCYEGSPFLGDETCNYGTPAYHKGSIAFTSSKNGKYDIHVLRPGSDKPENLTSRFYGQFSDPSFIDESTIVFAGFMKGKNSLFTIRKKDDNSSELVNLTPDFVNAGQPGANASEVAFTGILSGPATYNGNTDIYVLDFKAFMAGKQNCIKRITDQNILINENSPRFFGDFIYYGAARGNYNSGAFMVEDSNIYRYCSEGSGDDVYKAHEAVTESRTLKFHPKPYGKKLFFTVMTTMSSRNLYVKENDRQPRPVTEDMFIASYCICD